MKMNQLDDSRGILHPTRLPSFHRCEVPAELRELVRWIWVARWQLPAGEVSKQQVLPFPASNLVVETTGVTLNGPTTEISTRILRGTGWAVGALLRPAAMSSFPPKKNTVITIDAAKLHAVFLSENGYAINHYLKWLAQNLAKPSTLGLEANRMEEIISTDRSITQVHQLARRLHMSTRSVQRLANHYVGVTPLEMIRRYRLQEAAQRLRENPALKISEIAFELGYSDHAHLTADFRRVLGFSPAWYRSNAND